jgi:hypothetical protein
MTEEIPKGLQAQAERLERARENYVRFSNNLTQAINKLNPDGVTLDQLDKDPKIICRQFEAALTYLNIQEAEFAKQRETIIGVISGGALDLADAKEEILGRVACLRERTGG